MLAGEVLRFRGTIANRETEWDVMTDLYFYRDPEAEGAYPMNNLNAVVVLILRRDKEAIEEKASVDEVAAPIDAGFAVLPVTGRYPAPLLVHSLVPLPPPLLLVLDGMPELRTGLRLQPVLPPSGGLPMPPRVPSGR